MNKLIVFILCIFQLSNLNAQDYNNSKLKVFIAGEIPDLNYTKRSLTFIDFVTDQSVCDVYVLTTKQSIGINGNHYSFTFTNKTSMQSDEFVLNCNTYANDTPDVVRTKFTETLKSGLVPFLNRGDVKYSIIIKELEQTEKGDMELNNSIYPWNNWVFNIGLKGDFHVEEQKKKYGYKFEFDADRVTEMWRIRNRYYFQKQVEIIKQMKDSVSRKIHVLNQEQDIQSKIVYSISGNWSAGLFMEGYQDTYKNTKYNLSIKPTLEYNIFPWQELDRRVFTISYAIGPHWFGYYEPTIANKTSEYRMVESIKADVEVIEKWGVLEISLEGAHYFPNFKDYFFDLGIDLSIRIARGLFVDFGIQGNKINDQFYLPLGELSDEELLLNIRKLPTSYEVSGNFGISYQFGSIFSSIVNDRL
jgi:hypothetical protein